MNPLGPYGNIVASVLVVVTVIAAAASHLIPGLTPSAFLDNAALLALGVAFGTQVVQNGTQSAARTALALAMTAHTRLDAIASTGTGAPPSSGGSQS